MNLRNISARFFSKKRFLSTEKQCHSISRALLEDLEKRSFFDTGPFYEGAYLDTTPHIYDLGTESWTYTIDYGDGTTPEDRDGWVNLGDPYFSDTDVPLYHYYDDNATIRIIDNYNLSGGPGTPTQVWSADIENVAPTAELGKSYNSSTGILTASLTNASDPSSADTTAGFHYSFELNPANLDESYDEASTSNSAGLSISTAGNYTVYARIFDKDDGYTEYTFTNHAPTGTLNVGNGGRYLATDNAEFEVSDQADSDSGDLSAGLKYSFNFKNGEGWTTLTTSDSIEKGFGGGTHDYVVSARVFDRYGAYTELSPVLTHIFGYVNGVFNPGGAVGGQAPGWDVTLPWDYDGTSFDYHDDWSDSEVVPRNNCYDYATNRTAHNEYDEIVYRFGGPDGGMIFLGAHAEDTINLFTLVEDPENWYIIARGHDPSNLSDGWHFYRMDNSGNWTEKFATGSVHALFYDDAYSDPRGHEIVVGDGIESYTSANYVVIDNTLMTPDDGFYAVYNPRKAGIEDD